MELGEKILRARQELGLSQRQLCGDTITRNMLSQIEHGTARPSMDTLRVLAGRLGKPVSWFLEEENAVSANGQLLEQARAAHDRGDPAQVLAVLEDYRSPDALLDRECQLLQALARMALARQALREGKEPYARALLDEVKIPYAIPGLARQLALLRQDVENLPSLDGELFLRAKWELDRGELSRAAALLEAMEDREGSWHLLRGEIALRQRDYRTAAHYLHRAETDCPVEAAPGLEICYRELGDFRRAYEYACKQK